MNKCVDSLRLAQHTDTTKALGQCQDFLTTHLPEATRVKVTSTAFAAHSLLSSPRNHAAICSKVCSTLFRGLEVLRESIQKQTGEPTAWVRCSSDDDNVGHR